MAHREQEPKFHITAPKIMLYMRLAMIQSLHTVSGDAKCAEMTSLVSM